MLMVSSAGIPPRRQCTPLAGMNLILKQQQESNKVGTTNLNSQVL